MQQLNSTDVGEMHRVGAGAPDSYGRCLLCLRPTERNGRSVRVVENKQMYCDILQSGFSVQHNDTFQAQMRYLVCEKVALVCFVCAPAAKKAENQRQTGTKIDYPSAFLQNTLEHVAGQQQYAMNRQCLIKGLLCLGSAIELEGGVLYHELRCKERPLLEYTVHFFRYIMQETGLDLRGFSKASDLCVFAVVVLCKWHLLGFPHCMPLRYDNKIFRRMFNTRIFHLFCKLNTEVSMLSVRDNGASGLPFEVCAACACLKKPQAQGPAAPGGYDLATVDRARLRARVCAHRSPAECTGLQPLFCARTGKFSIASFENYGVAARVFPACFHETSEERYYVFALRHTPA